MSTARYSAISIGLHWLMLLLIAAAYVCIELREEYPKGSDTREALKSWHYAIGISVFILAWVRILFRNVGPSGGPSGANYDYRTLQGWLAKAVHIGLYAFMLAMPVLGYLILSAEGDSISYFGINLPGAVAPNRDLAGVFKEAHEVLGTVGYFLIGGHTIAALYHHYVKHDETLLRMLPGKR